ncbi:MAG TPA: 5-formyltetrahydrofolate cyclo-ligase [Bacillota bacterium]|nr:5-formyltetrahydrofolate cyclo-ligase [Bacillota bacterium]
MAGQLGEAKRELREQILTRRRQLPAAEAARHSRQIGDRLSSLKAYRQARCLLAYASCRNEVDTWGIMARCLAEGKALALPRVEPEGRLSLRLVQQPSRELARGYRGILEPLPGAPEVPREAIDLALVPGLAFDRLGNRLGQGGGYYDRLLSELRSAALASRRTTKAVAVGLAYEFQVVSRVPAGIADHPVDLVVTESGVWPSHPAGEDGGSGP